ncbi:MAG: hypothetical protein ACLU99_09090 [Alphaproteobacteria bacterium]
MKNKTILNLLIAAFALTSCSKESPELLPCMCDGTESTLGIFDCMCEPMKKKPVRRISYIKDERPMQTLIIDDEQRDAYLTCISAVTVLPRLNSNLLTSALKKAVNTMSLTPNSEITGSAFSAAAAKAKTFSLTKDAQCRRICTSLTSSLSR